MIPTKEKALSSRPISMSLIVLLLFVFEVSRPAWIAAQDFVLEEGITFGKVDGIELKLDLARPGNAQGPFPALVYLFGSGWGYWAGSRTESQLGIMKAAQRGYVAVTVDYRQTSTKENGKIKYPFPAQLYDAKCAIRWLRANANKYGIDADHIGAAGYSSGGHLALMLGLTVPTDGLEGYCGDARYSTKVQAVVSSGGPTELVSMFNESVDEPGPVVDLIGGNPQQKPREYAMASPLTYVTKDSPPTLIIQGDNDTDVPAKQAYLLDEKMTQVGVPHSLLIRKDGGHDDFTADPEVFDFFDKYLKK